MRQLQQVLLLVRPLLTFAAGPGRVLGCQLVVAVAAAASQLVSAVLVAMTISIERLMTWTTYMTAAHCSSVDFTAALSMASITVWCNHHCIAA
jgi:hypothetical protein